MRSSERKQSKRLRTLDLFHGAGGSSYGARKAGAEIVAGIDQWQTAGQAFQENFPGARVFTNDMTSISPDWMRDVIGEIDLLLASPECTNHTCAKGGAERCEESKMTAFQVVKFAKAFRPRWIVIENVVQMKSWSKHPELLEKLWGLGYYVKEEKLNAANFGVPQSRNRLFLLCALTGKALTPSAIDAPCKPASSIINQEADYTFSPLYSERRAKATLERAERAISQLGAKEPFLIVYYGSDGSGGWQTLDKPLRTITTLDRFAYVKPTKNGHVMRMLQPEELKLAMGFDECYRLEVGTRRDKIRLMGNAVCPPVMESIVAVLCQQG
jgi:DNA (cytosine-5)-methyltransferase 1